MGPAGRLLRAGLLVLAMTHAAVPGPALAEATDAGAAADPLSFDLPRARVLAIRAAMAGQSDVALSLSSQLLERDPFDPAALLAEATARLSRGETDIAYRSGRLAFRHAEDKGVKFQAARVAAVAAAAEDRVLPTQFWLRRAGDVAPNRVERRRVERQYRILQSHNPWRYRFDASVMPSDNVNGGADTPYNIIEGVPLVGLLSADAQALSGWVAQTNVDVSYRLRATADSRTQLTAGFYTKRAWLSDEARAAAPDFDAGTLSATTLSFGVDHRRALSDTGTVLGMSAGLRRNWQAGETLHWGTALGMNLRHPLGKRLSFNGNLQREDRFYGSGTQGYVNSAGLGLSWRMTNGARLHGTLSLTETKAERSFYDSHSVFGRLTYQFARPVATLDLAASIGGGVARYPDYSFVLFGHTDGRRDETVFFDIDARLTELEYAGFSPTVRLRRQRTTSTMTRYSTSEWALKLGVESNF